MKDRTHTAMLECMSDTTTQVCCVLADTFKCAYTYIFIHSDRDCDHPQKERIESAQRDQLQPALDLRIAAVCGISV